MLQKGKAPPQYFPFEEPQVEGGGVRPQADGPVLAPGFSLTLWAEVSHAPWGRAALPAEKPHPVPISAIDHNYIPFESSRP